MREFEWNATRDTSNWKIHYYGFTHPAIEHSFGRYMLAHQKQADCKMRESDNWWGTWSMDVSIDSLTRHVKDLEALHAWMKVYKARLIDDNWEEYEDTIFSFEEIPWAVNIKEVFKEEVLNSIRFNSGSYLLRLLKGYAN
jgi:hypothetical protein